MTSKWLRPGLLAVSLTAMLSGASLAAPNPIAPQEAISVKGSPEATRIVMRAYFKDIKRAQSIAHSRFETLESKYELGYVVVNASASEQRELRALGFRLEADHNWLLRQSQQAKQESSTSNATTVATAIPGYACYPTVEEVFASGNALIAAKPNLASWIDIGDSWEKANGLGGNDLKVLKITNSATNGTAGGKPKLFLQAGIHAREYTTTPLALELAKKLINGYGTDADMTWIVDHHEVHLLLVTNPDGRKQAETGLLWRKNANRNYCGSTSNTRGADLNRNFTFQWNSTGGTGSSGNACNETYRGPTAASEPEVQAIERYIRSLWPDRRGPNRGDAAPLDTTGIHLDIHSHGRLLLYPWGTNGSDAGNGVQLATLARKFSYWNGHTPQRGVELYETDGTSDGPSYGELGVPAFTFELGTAFFEQCSYYTGTILPKNLPSLVYAAKTVRTPYMTPAGPDVSAVAISNTAPVPPGTTLTVTATLDDTRYSNANGTEPTQNIAAAEYYVDLPPWAPGAVAIPMVASDGAFNAKTEGASASLNTTGLSAGKHLVYVRGKDVSGNWGAISAVFVNIGTGGNNNPVAAFDVSVNGLAAAFTDRSTSASGSTIASYAWNFGDGGTSTTASPNHAYAANGSYTVSLTVTDSANRTGSTSKSVAVTDDAVTALSNGQVVSGLSGAKGTWKFYKLNVPVGATKLRIATSGGTGDVDLYTQLGVKPTTSSYNCAKTGSTNAEVCSAATPTAGWTYIGLYSYAATTGVSLKVSYTAAP